MLLMQDHRDVLTEIIADAGKLDRVMRANTVTAELLRQRRAEAKALIKRVRSRLRDLEGAL